MFRIYEDDDALALSLDEHYVSCGFPYHFFRRCTFWRRTSTTSSCARITTESEFPENISGNFREKKWSGDEKKKRPGGGGQYWSIAYTHSSRQWEFTSVRHPYVQKSWSKSVRTKPELRVFDEYNRSSYRAIGRHGRFKHDALLRVVTLHMFIFLRGNCVLFLVLAFSLYALPWTVALKPITGEVGSTLWLNGVTPLPCRRIRRFLQGRDYVWVPPTPGEVYIFCQKLPFLPSQFGKLQRCWNLPSFGSTAAIRSRCVDTRINL